MDWKHDADRQLWLSRRRFVRGLAAGGLVGALSPRSLWAAGSDSAQLGMPVLQGPQLQLDITAAQVNFTGRSAMGTAVNGGVPAPLLRLREGDLLQARVSNHLSTATAIHWHGLIVPAGMDGVPGLSFAGIAPGASFDYRFALHQSGTYWYHAHAGFQEQTGLYGPLVIEPRNSDPFAYDRDYVVMLSDWSDTAPQRILTRLKKQASYYNHQQRTVSELLRDIQAKGAKAAFADRREWGQMRMTPTDRADVDASAYTYLLNGRTPAANWTGLFKPGERLRLRFINAGAMTYFDVRIPGLRMTVVAADGQLVEPVVVDEFRLAAAETLDVIVEPRESRAFTLFAQSMDRSGYARGSLAPAARMVAAVPRLDRPARLTMADMGHHHAAAVAGLDEPDHAAMMVAHPASEAHNPNVDMQTHMPLPKLDDPGIGLREEQLLALRDDAVPGHRVLRLSDLRSTFADPDGRIPLRTIELHLTGNMDRYVWGFDGLRYGQSEPIVLQAGERVRFVLINDTMMEHPIHLHGLWSDIEDETGEFQVRKHTLSMPPGTRRSFRVTADATGRWAFHCHMMFHMALGMFREVQVS
jgi:FtsP/CotA-like multicopper oxidase with cupredoxin domain